MFTNYPLQIGEWKFDKNDYFRYLKTFDEHTITFIHKNDNTLISSHKYKDGLHIILRWKIKDNIPDNYKLVDFKSLENLKNSNAIKCNSVEVISYSQNYESPNEEIFSLFKEILKARAGNLKRLLTKEEYYRLEYSVTYTPEEISTISIPDTFFNQLVDTIAKHIEFEKYLSERENQKT